MAPGCRTKTHSPIEPLEARIAPAFAATFNLADLNGINGFKLSGEADSDLFGGLVSGAGDLNGDGFDDLIIGAYQADPNGSSSGASYVVFGKAGGFSANLNLSALDGTNGFKLSGVAAYDRSGVSVSGAGDLNGDGFDDLIIGAYRADPNGSSSGASYVVFGKVGGFSANLNLSALDGTHGFKLSGVAADDRSGVSVSGAGDLNGDGFDDLIIAASYADPNGSSSGASYVVFGKAGGFLADLNLSALDGTNGFKLSGEAAYDFSGNSVSSAGDLNGDGFDDLIIGAHYADPNGSSSGASYVIFGKAGGFSANLNFSVLDGINGFKLSGVAAYDRSGVSVSGAGDLNGDGFDDLIIGAYDADPNGSASGASYVLFGKTGGFLANLNLSALDGTNGFKLSGVATDDRSGGSVSGAGDLNGDGFDDVIIGAYQADPNGSASGASYVVFGKAGGFSANLNLSALDGTNGFKLSGVTADDFSGRSVSGAGDLNGDGFDDLIIGANGADPNGSASGASYVVFGQPQAGLSPFRATIELSSLTGANGFKLSGVAAGDFSGHAVSAAGDINGDGIDDVIIGAHGADPNGSYSGASYVVFGSRAGFGANLDLSGLTGANGVKISGVAAFDNSGIAVSAAGDINGDGLDDLIIGAYLADPNGSASGASYVVFGSRGGFGANLNLSGLTGANGFQISGVAAGDRSGFAVSGAGDINGDGLDDLIIGASRADPNGTDSGASYVVFGSRAGFPANVDLSALTGGNGFKISGVAASDYSGGSVSAAGDINGDGIDDLIIGAFRPNQNSFSGTSYVVFGSRAGFAANVDLSALTGANGFRISGVAPGTTDKGVSVSEAGDINGDGIDDLIIASFGPVLSPNGGKLRASYVVFGNRGGFASNVDLAGLTGANGFRINGVVGGGSGEFVSAAGDINGDGVDDLIIGADGPDYGTGAGYVLFGSRRSFGANVDLSELTGANGFKIKGVADHDRTGVSVSAAGDINGDGVDDLIIGADYADPNGFSSGASYVVFGHRGVPAIFSTNQKTVTFTDPDGDIVTLKVSKGQLEETDFSFTRSGDGVLLKKLDLTGHAADFKGAKITITAKAGPVPAPLGPQLFALGNVGVAAAGSVGIPGVEIGEIDASGVDLRNLTVQGDVTRLTVGSGSVTKTVLKVFKVNSLGEGRDRFPDLTPALNIKGAIGKVVVLEDVTGVDVTVDRGLGQFVVGGAMADSDFDIGSTLSVIKVGGAMTGSSVKTAQGLGKLIVTGALSESSFDIAASLSAVKALAGIDGSTFKIAQVLGSLSVTGNLGDSDVNVGTAVKKVKVVGSVADSEITVGGVLQPRNAGKAKAIGGITIVGDFERSQILAGYDLAGAAKNADVIVGGITITGRFKESSIVAGVLSTDGTFGSGDDGLIGGGNGVIAKIAAITIKGEVLGTPGNADDGFGIVAEQIGKLKIGTTAVVLNRGFSNDPSTAIGGTDDVRVHEVGSII